MVVARVVGRKPVKDRIVLMRACALARVLRYSLVLLLGCVTSGCGANPSTEPASSSIPEGMKIMKEQMKSQMKNQMKQQTRLKARTQPGGPPGR
jgi:hypothetical protein